MKNLIGKIPFFIFLLFLQKSIIATGIWLTAAEIENSANVDGNPSLAVDCDGNAISVWRQANSIYYALGTAAGGFTSDAVQIQMLYKFRVRVLMPKGILQ